jgi:hypothetical protein
MFDEPENDVMEMAIRRENKLNGVCPDPKPVDKGLVVWVD